MDIFEMEKEFNELMEQGQALIEKLKRSADASKTIPRYWLGLCALQDRTDRPFKGNKTIYDFEKEFKEEE